MPLMTPWKVARPVFLDTTIVLDGIEVDVHIEAKILLGIPGWENHPYLGEPEISGYKIFEANTRIEITIPEDDEDLKKIVEDRIWFQVEDEELY